MNNLLRKLTNAYVDFVLWILIVIGLLLRAIYPFINNPINHLITDPGRHYFSALGLGKELFSFLEPLGYHLWLASVINFFGNGPIAMASCAALLSVTTVVIWYFWYCQCLPSKRIALVGFAILALLPSWLGIYAYFMGETLLLPLLGLALWLSWRAFRIQSHGAVIACAIAWSCALLTKLNVLPEAVIVLTYLFYQIYKNKGRRFFMISLIPSLLILLLVFLAGPINMYRGLGTAWLWPPGGGWTYINQAYYLSGARTWTAEFTSKRCGRQYINTFASNSTVQSEPLQPFSAWSSGRNGNCHVVIDCDRPFSLWAPRLPNGYRQDSRLIIENVFFFFFGHSWPDDDRQDLIQECQVRMSWIWALIAAAIVILAVKRRRFSLVVWLSIVSAICFCFQQYGLMEGRYRKPWEGIAIAALLCTLSRGCGAKDKIY